MMQKLKQRIEKVKDKVALKHGYSNNILGSSWEYAMLITYRTKMQLQLYEEVIIELMEGKINYD